jgi:hypothetical protein
MRSSDQIRGDSTTNPDALEIRVGLWNDMALINQKMQQLEQLWFRAAGDAREAQNALENLIARGMNDPELEIARVNLMLAEQRKRNTMVEIEALEDGLASGDSCLPSPP